LQAATILATLQLEGERLSLKSM